MKSYTLTQLIRNVVEKQNGTLRKVGSVWCVSKIPDVELVMTIIYNILPASYEIKTGRDINNHPWMHIYPSLEYEDNHLYEISFE